MEIFASVVTYMPDIFEELYTSRVKQVVLVVGGQEKVDDMLSDMVLDQIANVELVVQSNARPEKPQGT